MSITRERNRMICDCSGVAGRSLTSSRFSQDQFTRMLNEKEDTPPTGNKKKSPEKVIDTQKKKKKKRRKASTICTANCRYSVIRRIAKAFNMRDVGERYDWNVYWSDCYISADRAKDMRRFQKVNHFPGMSEICRKDLLARNLNRMLKLFPKEYNFFPKTWCLPADLFDAITYSRNHRNKTYIIKPDIGSQGKGIFITKTLKDLKPFERLICQVYISKPFLMDGLKFDLRIYTLITSCDPLRIYVYNEGLARFATSRYCEPAAQNNTNMYMHLTNYSVNKHSRTFVVDDEAGTKRRISTVNAWLERKHYNVPKIWAAIDEIIVKTIISACPALKHAYHTCFPCHEFTFACFELLGFDILLDNKFKPHLLEVNHSPSFHTDTDLDKDVKESLLKDTFRILNLSKCDKKRAVEEDKQRVRNRLMQVIRHKGLPPMNESTQSPTDTNKTLNAQTKWEANHLGNYRQVYPSPDADKYAAYFNQTQRSLYQETFASRARGEAGKLQREEFELKLRGDRARRLGLNSKLMTESTALQKPKVKNILMKKKPPCNSLDPMPIVKANEKGRLAGLAQREFLLRSNRVVDQTDSEENVPTTHSLKRSTLKPPLTIQKSRGTEEAYLNDRWKTTRNCFFKNPVKKTMEALPGLETLTNEATLRTRADLPVSTTLGGKSTKTHLQHCQTARDREEAQR